MKIIKLIPFLILLLSSFSSFASFPIERTKSGEIVLKEENDLKFSTTISQDSIKISKTWTYVLSLFPIINSFGPYSFYMGHTTKGIVQSTGLPLSVGLGILFLNLARLFYYPSVVLVVLGIILYFGFPAIFLFLPYLDAFRILFGHLKPAKGYYFD